MKNNYFISNYPWTMSQNGTIALNQTNRKSMSSYSENSYQLPMQNSFLISSVMQNTEFEKSIDNISVPIDYPKISSSCFENAKRVGYRIISDYNIKPKRISASVEGGIALIYQRITRRLFSYHSYELFIEVYNDNSMCAVNLVDNKAIHFAEVDNDGLNTFVDKFIEDSSK